MSTGKDCVNNQEQMHFYVIITICTDIANLDDRLTYPFPKKMSEQKIMIDSMSAREVVNSGQDCCDDLLGAWK